VSAVELDFEGHKRDFVIKEYQQPQRERDNHFKSAKGSVTRSVTAYEALKLADCPTYTTFRVGENGTSLLMNNLNIDGVKALSVFTTPVEWSNEDGESEVRLEEINNLEELVTDSMEVACKAAKGGVELQPDSYFFLTHEEEAGQFHVESFVGDFEGIDIWIEHFKELEYSNLNDLKNALLEFVDRYVVSERHTEYRNLVIEKFT